jgi:hypothetical protein
MPGTDASSGAAARAARDSIVAVFNNVALTFDFESILLAGLSLPEGQPFDWSSLIVGSIGSRSSADPAGDASPRAKHWHLEDLSITPAQTTAALLSAGFVWWSLRVAGLVTSMLASSPVWRHLDPVPILVADPDDDQDADGEASVPPDEEAARDESASRELFADARRTREARAL